MERRLGEAASKAAASRVYASRLAIMARQALERGAGGQQGLSEAVKRELQEVVRSGVRIASALKKPWQTSSLRRLPEPRRQR